MAIIKIVDDNNDERVFLVQPETVICTDEYVMPCVCGRVVLFEIDGNDSNGCSVCKEEEMDELKTRNDMAKWLEERGWEFMHPGYWRLEMSNNITVMVGEYIGFYLLNDEGQTDQPFMTVDYKDFEGDKVVDLIRCSLLPEGVADAVLVALKYDTFKEPAEEGNWRMACGEIIYPDGIMVYHKDEPFRRVLIPGDLLTDRPVEEWDADDHAYLASLGDLVKRWLEDNIC